MSQLFQENYMHLSVKSGRRLYKKLLLEAVRLIPEGVFRLQFKSGLSHKVEEIFTPDAKCGANSGNFRFTAGSRNRTGGGFQSDNGIIRLLMHVPYNGDHSADRTELLHIPAGFADPSVTGYVSPGSG